MDQNDIQTTNPAPASVIAPESVSPKKKIGAISLLIVVIVLVAAAFYRFAPLKTSMSDSDKELQTIQNNLDKALDGLDGANF